MPTDLWRQCFLAALTGYVANPLTGDAQVTCDEIAEWSATQADEAVKVIERRWPVKKVRTVRRWKVARGRDKSRSKLLTKQKVTPKSPSRWRPD